ncbi:hypothetical protein B0H17DRAFT_1216648 [Mycena rosella]|uniref:Uncharacterized protein n=1 Tax=Mycena rosella TaxID=1033263 RepID=A0AAD7C688_MYCRO|nr:hypothetical protein B0H17DRAFT_1216648 [Mycena rosella]
MASESNLVPADWAESTNDVLGAHLTPTPLGTHGPSAPGAFPDALAEEASYADAAKEQMLLDSARQYLPTQEDVAGALENVKAYLPAQDVVVRLKARRRTFRPEWQHIYVLVFASLTSHSHPQTRAKTQTAALPSMSGTAPPSPTPNPPQTLRAGALSGTEETHSSTAVTVGHGASVPYTGSALEPYSTIDVARVDSTRVLTGHSVSTIPALAHTGRSVLSSRPPSEIMPPPNASPAPSTSISTSTSQYAASLVQSPPSYAASTPILGADSGYTASRESGLLPSGGSDEASGEADRKETKPKLVSYSG